MTILAANGLYATSAPLAYVPAMADVREINRIDDFSDYRSAWSHLLAATPSASFFQTMEWLKVYWRHFGEGLKLRVLVVFAENQPAGILPLVVARDATKVGRLRVLTYPLHGWGSFYGPIGANPTLTLGAAFHHIHHRKRDWDVIEPRWLGAAETDLAQTVSAMKNAGFQAYPTCHQHTSIIDFASGWDAWLAGRSRAWRRNLRQDQRAVSRLGNVEFVRYRPRGTEFDEDDPRWNLYDACEAIAQRSWQGGADDGTTLSHATVRAYFRETHQVAAAAGAVDVNLLLIDKQPVAFLYNYVWKGRLYGLRMGFDASLCPDGAGNVLMARTLADSFERGDKQWDLGVGVEGYKAHLRTAWVGIYRASHFHPTVLRAQLLRVRRWAESRSGCASGMPIS